MLPAGDASPPSGASTSRVGAGPTQPPLPNIQLQQKSPSGRPATPGMQWQQQHTMQDRPHPAAATRPERHTAAAGQQASMSPASVTLLAALASSDPLEAAEAVEHRTDSGACRLAHHQAVCVAAAAGATAGTLHERSTSPGGRTQAVWGGAADAAAGTAGNLQERGQRPGQAPASEMTLAAAHQGAALRSSQQDWQIIGRFCSLTVPKAWLRGVVRAWRRAAWVLQHGRRLRQVGVACTGPWCAAQHLCGSSAESQWCLSWAALSGRGCLSRLHMLGAGRQTGCCCCVPGQGSPVLSVVAPLQPGACCRRWLAATCGVC